ncbi:MAG: hypothetical protein LH468_12490 [Nocardioides sp.]|nr:hypothetical protein [Nocardioides sp.]
MSKFTSSLAARRVVMDLMGWSAVAMLKRYQHVIDSLRRDAADRMGALLSGDPTEASQLSNTDDSVGPNGSQSLAGDERDWKWD